MVAPSSHRVCCILVALSGMVCVPCQGAPVSHVWADTRPGDACMILAVSPDLTGDNRPELIAGYDSGTLVCWDSTPTSPLLQLWATDLGSAVLALLPVADVNADGKRDLVAADILGNVSCMTAEGDEAGTILWSFASASSIAVLECIPDLTGDGVAETIAGGSEQVLFLRNGATGAAIWTRDLVGLGGTAYLHRIIVGDDLNADGEGDAVFLDWNGRVQAFRVTTGESIWSKSVTGGFTEALARLGDVNGDGRSEFAAGGNNQEVRLVSGSDGAQRWSCALGRPVRAIVAVPDLDDDATTDCVAATAGGLVAAVSGAGTGTRIPLWSADMGDACRAVVSPGDLDGDGLADVVAGAENGLVAAFSGADGSELGRWQGADVVRALIAINDVDGDTIPDAVVGCIDGTVAILSSSPGEWTPAGGAIAAAETESPTYAETSIHISSAQTNATRVPILLYHDVLPVMKYPYGVSRDNFRAQMDVLVAGGYTAVTLDEVADWIEGKITLPEKSVCITFDGPYEGQFLYADPILAERGLKSHLYVTTDWIGTANHAEWHQLRAIDATGVVDIQNHTINHPSLASQTREVVIEQISLCNESIARHLNGKIATHHAYPSGSYNSTVMGILAELGVRTATTVESRAATRSDKLLALPRFGITPSTSLGTFKSWIQYAEPPLSALPYRFVGTVGTGWNQPSFADVDAQGRLWVCEYGGGRVRVFEPSGVEAAFSPITQGQTGAGTTRSLATASGIAVTPAGQVLVTIADYQIAVPYFGVFIYEAATGNFVRGIDLAYRPGDVDCDADGRIYIVDKVVDNFHVYSAEVVELAGSPIGSGTTSHIQRGLSVLPDASRVYVISETDGAVHVWNGTIDESGCHYTQGDALVTGLGGQSGGVDVMDNGTVFVGDDGQARVMAYDAGHALLGALSGGTPSLTLPRGVAYTADGSVVWVISRSGFVQRWERSAAVNGWVTF